MQFSSPSQSSDNFAPVLTYASLPACDSAWSASIPVTGCASSFQLLTAFLANFSPSSPDYFFSKLEHSKLTSPTSLPCLLPLCTSQHTDSSSLYIWITLELVFLFTVQPRYSPYTKLIQEKSLEVTKHHARRVTAARVQCSSRKNALQACIPPGISSVCIDDVFLLR